MELTKCPKCGGIHVGLTEYWTVAQTWYQGDGGVSEDFSEHIIERADDLVRADCYMCYYCWSFEGEVEVGEVCELPNSGSVSHDSR